MNILSREKQIEVIAALCEGVGIRTAARLTGVNRGTVGSLALRVTLAGNDELAAMQFHEASGNIEAELQATAGCRQIGMAYRIRCLGR